jgi:lipase ATG15
MGNLLYKDSGTCHGFSSACYWFDYALESQCHIGYECTYTPSLLSMDARNNSDPNMDAAVSSIKYHSIDWVIKYYLEGATSVPECKVKMDCIDRECPFWTWVE